MKIDISRHEWAVILNSQALKFQRGKGWKRIERLFRQNGIAHRLFVSQNQTDASDMIRQLIREGKRHFIVLGGDGTINHFVNHVMHEPIDHKEIFLVPFILGTGNDCARTHFTKNSFMKQWEQFLAGNFASHDVGKVTVLLDQQPQSEHYFVNIAGFGFDAEVIRNTLKRKFWIFPKLKYIHSLLVSLFRYQPTDVEIQSTDFQCKKKLFSLAVGIGSYNGNGIKQCPDASPVDGEFDIIVIEKPPILKLIPNVPKIFRGTHVTSLKEITQYKSDQLTIHAVPHIYGEVEGEMLPLGSYHIVSMPQAIQILSEKWN